MLFAMTQMEAPLVPLRVAAAEPIAEDIHRFELRAVDGAALAPFTPGAHIGIAVPGGQRRKYSLCNDPADADRYEIAVKRESGGRGGSCAMVERVHAGDLLPCATPRNDFALPQRLQSVVFIAGGIGITPILSMVRHLKSTGRARFRLYYLTRSAPATAFRDVLSAPDFHGQVVIHHDHGDPAQSFDLWPVLERPAGSDLFCCGPRAMLESIRDMTGHWSPARVHFESFVDAAATRTATDRAFRVRLARSGRSVEVAADRSILDALRDAGLTVASSCESGTCGTCRTGLLAGDAEHRDLVLTDAERDDSIMICVSRARAGDLELDL
jgi:phthalate 4,5-dioxygenase reductase subunit